MIEGESENLFEQKESATPKPSLLDVVMIDNRLAQVTPTTHNIIFLDEKATGEPKWYDINWDSYECEEVSSRVGDLRRSNQISKDEYMAVHWGPEEEEHPHLRDHVTFFGKYKSKKDR